jgi:alkylation response protein AidB-like acyl-CoA dehydrogenase
MSSMDFAPTEAQHAIERAAAGVLDGTGADEPEKAWRALAQAGLLALVVPGELGGEGLGLPELGALLTEVGRRAAPVPALPTLAAAALPVARWGTPGQRRHLLAGLDTGDRILTAALREPGDPFPPAPTTRATPNLAVTGTKIGVWYAAEAYRILVPVSRADGGTGVVLVDPAGPGVTLRCTPSAADLPEYTVELDHAPAEEVPGCDPAGLYRAAVAGACALGAGLLAGALALTTAHLARREQFGRPLATFQAAAQQIADVYIAARTVHLAALAAAERPESTDVEVAAYWFTSAAPGALRTCHHLHGGLGLDVSYPLHRHSAQVKDLVRFLGGAEYCLETLGRVMA